MNTQFTWNIADRKIDIILRYSHGELPVAWFDEAQKYSTTKILKGKADLTLIIEPKLGYCQPDKGTVVEESDGQPDFRIIRINRDDLSGKLVKHGDSYEGRFVVDPTDVTTLTAVARTCLSFLCEEQGQIMLHASGVRRNGKLWIFSGESNSGKSTIAGELNDAGEAFASDRVILALRDDGKIVAYSTPFSDHKQEIGAPESGEIAGIMLIEQAGKDFISPVSSAETVKRILKESLTFTRNVVVWDRLMKLVGSIIDQGLCMRMGFRKDVTFWKLIDGVVINRGESNQGDRE